MREMEIKLQDYIKGKIDYTPIMNFMMNYRSEDLYDKLGKYIVDILDINKIPDLSFLAKKLPQNKGIISRISSFGNDRVYSTVAMFFVTSTLDEKVLKKMFGEPLKHSEFGEGFDKKRNYTYISYFVTLDNIDFHIGKDHRGTRIEIGIPYRENFSKEDSLKCFDGLKKIIDLYKQKAYIS